MDNIDNIAKLKNMIEQADKVVFFGGAGVSTESGIPDFRSPDGLYNQQFEQYGYAPEEILSHRFFFSRPDIYYLFHKKRLLKKRDAKPNPAHYALAELEKQGKLTAVVTQNIDGLHQKAGSKNVYELHGSMLRNYCIGCNKYYDVEYVENATGIPMCEDCRSMIKPDIVLYGESLDQETIRNAVIHIAEADLLIVGGTSLSVYPAASLIEYFKGNHLVLINKTATAHDKIADLIIRDAIGDVFAQLMEK